MFFWARGFAFYNQIKRTDFYTERKKKKSSSILKCKLER